MKLHHLTSLILLLAPPIAATAIAIHYIGAWAVAGYPFALFAWVAVILPNRDDRRAH